MLAFFVTLQTLGISAHQRLTRKDDGATAVEYGLMVGLIAVVIIVAVTALGGQLDALFTDVSDQLPAPAPANP